MTDNVQRDQLETTMDEEKMQVQHDESKVKSNDSINTQSSVNSQQQKGHDDDKHNHHHHHLINGNKVEKKKKKRKFANKTGVKKDVVQQELETKAYLQQSLKMKMMYRTQAEIMGGGMRPPVNMMISPMMQQQQGFLQQSRVPITKSGTGDSTTTNYSSLQNSPMQQSIAPGYQLIVSPNYAYPVLPMSPIAVGPFDPRFQTMSQYGAAQSSSDQMAQLQKPDANKSTDADDVKSIESSQDNSIQKSAAVLGRRASTRLLQKSLKNNRDLMLSQTEAVMSPTTEFFHRTLNSPDKVSNAPMTPTRAVRLRF
ncbi:hypothetical protein MP228_011157 [Amoeboaphelidium protococcarum]|nr:hypothetical protein MP228_011157 [Amoeboaphelidium protococcarum]